MRRVISLAAAIVFAVVVLAACNSKDKSVAATGCGRGGSVAAPTLVVPSDGVPRISLDSLRAALDKGTVIVVDTRPAEQYKLSHIKGSINIPVDQVANRINELPCDKFIVTYCSWPSEHTSARAVQTMKEKGIDNAAALLGGTNAWQSAGLPMESSQ